MLHSLCIHTGMSNSLYIHTCRVIQFSHTFWYVIQSLHTYFYGYIVFSQMLVWLFSLYTDTGMLYSLYKYTDMVIQSLHTGMSYSVYIYTCMVIQYLYTYWYGYIVFTHILVCYIVFTYILVLQLFSLNTHTCMVKSS